MSGDPPSEMSLSIDLMGIPLNKVGIRNLREKVCFKDFDKSVCYDAVLDVAVDLPAGQGDVHLSRSIEAIIWIHNSSNFSSFEEVTERICRELLMRHEYSSCAYVKLKTWLFYEYEDPVVRFNRIPVKLTIECEMRRHGSVRKRVCVGVMGVTVCPKSLRACQHIVNNQYMLSHTQRAFLKLCIEYENSSMNVSVEDIVKTVLEAFSIPVYLYLKKESECKVLLDGFKNPKLGEDVVRGVLYRLYKNLWGKIPRNSIVRVYLNSFESLHPYNLYIHVVHTMEDLRNYIVRRLQHGGTLDC